jgi:hypothetical protein
MLISSALLLLFTIVNCQPVSKKRQFKVALQKGYTPTMNYTDSIPVTSFMAKKQKQVAYSHGSGKIDLFFFFFFFLIIYYNIKLIILIH